MAKLPRSNIAKSIARAESDASSSGAEPAARGVRDLLTAISREAKALAGIVPDDPRQPAPAIPTRVAALKELLAQLSAGPSLEDLARDSSAAVESFLGNLPGELKNYCDSRGIQLYCAFPDYIANGTIYLSFDIKRHAVTVNDLSMPLVPFADVVAALQREASRLDKETFQPTPFLERLWTTHQTLITRPAAGTDTSSSRRAPIFSVLAELAFDVQSKAFMRSPSQKNFRPYSQHTFRADLFRLLRVNVEPVAHGHRLILEPTSVAEDGLFMYLPVIGRCAFVGHITFVPIDGASADSR